MYYPCNGKSESALPQILNFLAISIMSCLVNFIIFVLNQVQGFYTPHLKLLSVYKEALENEMVSIVLKVLAIISSVNFSIVELPLIL